MSDWTNPKHAALLGAYQRAQGEHRYWRPRRSQWSQRSACWCDGFTMVADPDSGAVFVAAEARPPQETET